MILTTVTPALEGPHLPAEFPARDGDREGTAGLDLREYVDHVCRQIEEWPPAEIVLVAHSIGGVIGKEVAEVLAFAPDRRDQSPDSGLRSRLSPISPLHERR